MSSQSTSEQPLKSLPADGPLQEIRAESSLTDRVRDSIRQAIIDGQLAPGSLHSVQSLADIFKVSRTPVREALIDLTSAGMVEFERNRGVRILETSVHDLEEILMLRILLEVPATFRAASQFDEEGLRLLRAELKAMKAAAKADDEPTMMHHDRVFHELINSTSGNSRLTLYVDSLRDLILTRGVSTVKRTRTLKDIVAEHGEILEALEGGDPEAAAAAMKSHLVNTAALRREQEGGRDSAVELGWEGLVVGGSNPAKSKKGS
jgi:DNA-binding GntR family transcriptional regulator